VAILVLEAVAPGAATTAEADEHTPASAAPGVDTADGGSAANRLMSKVDPAALGKTVLTNGDPPTTETTTQLPQQQ
jgi:hypothetical protein